VDNNPQCRTYIS